MVANRGRTATVGAQNSVDREPRTARGRRTQRAVLDAATAEFGEKGFHDSSIVSITARAGVALGTFYTYYESKEALFRALVSDMSGRVRDLVAPAVAQTTSVLDGEGVALATFLAFAREHKEIYRIIDEAEFVAPEAWRLHYEGAAARIVERLRAGETRGEVTGPIDEAHGWAIMGMNVFLGLRYGIQKTKRPLEEIAAIGNGLIRHGIIKRGRKSV